MNETLTDLVRRRRRELGVHGDPISTRQVWIRGGGEGAWSYETVRRIVELGHHRIGDRIIDRLAVALDVPVSQVIAAAGQRPRLGRFQLPARADRLTEPERQTIVAVVDAILNAADQPRPELTAARARARSTRTGPQTEPSRPPTASRRGSGRSG